jgi:hypothetical protein
MAQAEGMGLDTLTSPSSKRPLIFTVVGDGGMGKTTLGSLFPNPVFIRTEDGTKSLQGRVDVALFPVAKSISDVMNCVYSLIQENHAFKTLIVDTVTQFNVMAEAEVIAADGKAKSINQAAGGYGAGHAAVASIHRNLREACGFLSAEKNMHIIFLAHADIDTIDLPDQEQFMRYTLRMNKRSLSSYIDNVDIVAYIKMKMFTTGDGDTKKATTDGTRIVTCHPCPSHVSKNRLGIKEDLPFVEGVNPFEEYLQ